MGRQIESKLNRLLGFRPRNVVLCSRWLVNQGYSRQLIKKYCDSAWLQKISHGAYSRVGDKIEWIGAVYALQNQLNYPIHVGGLSALEIYGLAQYLVIDKDKNPIKLYNTTEKKIRLPKWFTSVFQHIYYQHHLFVKQVGIETKAIDGINIFISSPERAILEVLDLVPNIFDFQHASELVENMRLIRPDKMQNLLQHCISYKTKRMLLYLADKHQLPFFSHIDIRKIDLGKGKRTIGIGGKYISKYKLSVPKLNDEQNDEEINYV